MALDSSQALPPEWRSVPVVVRGVRQGQVTGKSGDSQEFPNLAAAQKAFPDLDPVQAKGRFTTADRVQLSWGQKQLWFTAIAIRLSESARDRFVVTVDYTKPLKDIVNAGKYDRVDEDILKLPLHGSGIVTTEVVLVHFEDSHRIGPRCTDFFEEMEQMGLVPARIEHLLAFGAAYPQEPHRWLTEFERQFGIVCLGSVRLNNSFLADHPSFAGGSWGRELRLGGPVGGGLRSSRFIAIWRDVRASQIRCTDCGCRFLSTTFPKLRPLAASDGTESL